MFYEFYLLVKSVIKDLCLSPLAASGPSSGGPFVPSRLVSAAQRPSVAAAAITRQGAQMCGSSVPPVSACWAPPCGSEPRVWKRGTRGRPAHSLRLCRLYLRREVLPRKTGSDCCRICIENSETSVPGCVSGCLCVPRMALDTDANKIDTASW